MSTQIFINPNTCKPEFTKIAGHSFTFTPNVIDPVLFSGGTLTGQSIWSVTTYDYSNAIFAPVVLEADKNAGIPLPINLIPDDIVTISGTAYFNNVQAYVDENFDVSLVLGVYYFGCRSNDATGFTFIPIESFAFKTNNSLCFETSVTLGSSFDIHDTRFLVGFNIAADCLGPGECIYPILAEPDLATVSYTFDIERPCAVGITNFIIRNCCEPIITELVNIAGLTVGSFHVDDEGNCWEVMSASQDVTNFTRNFVDIYTSCVECQTVNPCPLNLTISSCCVIGTEYVTGSLPGLNVGDTFVDNNGLCWSVAQETGAPISEESITVDTIVTGDCFDCTDANPCPEFWVVSSCCGTLEEIIATTVALNTGDAFVDTNGICWTVEGSVSALPTNYGIVVDTVYTGAVFPDTNCSVCIAANPCPTEYFLTIRMCCDNDRVEVTSVPSAFMSFSEGSIFSDPYGLCWEVMSYSTIGVETYPINWTSAFISNYQNCFACINSKGKALCIGIWEVRDCATDIVYVVSSASSGGLATIGSFYNGSIVGLPRLCLEVLGYGYPALGIAGQLSLSPELGSCEECSITLDGIKTVELQPCCGGPNIIVQTTVGFSLGIGAAYVFALNGIDKRCYTLIGYSLSSPSFVNPPYFGGYIDCTNCIQRYSCLAPPPVSNFREVILCCNGQTIVVNFGTYSFPFPPANVYVYNLTNLFNPGLSGNYCCTIGPSVPPSAPIWTFNNAVTAFTNCPSCTMMYPSCL
jgi:hypothetical protein